MTLARAQLVDPSVTRWYHCITRCVRRAHLLGEGLADRKQWLEDQLRVSPKNVAGTRRVPSAKARTRQNLSAW